MGAWIEILLLLICFCNCTVAPLVGAWIEINLCEVFGNSKDVAPLVGAWIEITNFSSNFFLPSLSHPSWVRGLKLITFLI